ncbi:MAG: 6-phosphofructokinase 1 [Oceanospirillaceae bacterium]|jgi:6-phosphofructokinase 1
MNQEIKRIGVFTSGGDSPGMNACIRSVVRTGLYLGLEVYGIHSGYKGMIEGHLEPMESHDVSNIIQRGGTILKTARSKEFHTEEGMQKAYRNLLLHKIDAVVAIGGDGTFTGANEFSKSFDIPFIGLPGTIDNDLVGTDFTIGYDTALNTVVSAVDKIRDTAASHDRLFLVEVMGKDAGFIALRSGIGVGAESILVPETETHMDNLISVLKKGWERKKTSSIVIIAEGDDAGGALKVAKRVNRDVPEYDTRVTILGHIQRGGSPSAMDRVLASRLGNAAVKAILAEKSGVMVGVVNGEVAFTPFSNAIKHNQGVNQELMDLARVLSF